MSLGTFYAMPHTENRIAHMYNLDSVYDFVILNNSIA